MKTFTLELSREAMLLLQLKLPKGCTLVKTAGENKKKSKSIKNLELSVEESFHDAPSQDFEPTAKKGKPKATKAPIKDKQEPKIQTTKIESVSKDQNEQTVKIKNKSIPLKKGEKKSNKGKQEAIFDSEDEDTTSQPKIKSKPKTKEEKLKNKTQKDDPEKEKKSIVQKPIPDLEKYQKDNFLIQKNQKNVEKSTIAKDESPKIEQSQKVFEKAQEIPGNRSNKENIQEEGKNNKNQEKNVLDKWEQIDKKGSKKKLKPKKYSYEDRLGIISRIRAFDRKTMSEFFKAINFSKGQTLDFKVMDDSQIEPIDTELTNFEKLLKERLREEKKKIQQSNPKSLDDFEMAEDEDYDD